MYCTPYKTQGFEYNIGFTCLIKGFGKFKLLHYLTELRKSGESGDFCLLIRQERIDLIVNLCMAILLAI